MKRWSKVLLGVGVLLGGTLIATTPANLDYSPPVDASPNLDSLVRDNETGLIPGTEKRIVWNGAQEPTEWSVVALHGFSASRQESAPLAELVATSLGANLFETRFAGHGLQHNALVEVTAEDWLDDAAQALTVGQLIGKKVVVIAVSNGAALALSMLGHSSMDAVDSLIMISPNFGPADPNAVWITRPGGPLLLRLISGESRSWEAQNELQEKFWSTRYPTRTVVEVMRVVDRVKEKVATATAPRTQVFYSPDDTVISVSALEAAYAILKSPQKEIHAVTETGSSSAHVIVGDIMSPDNTSPMAARITDFVLRRAQ